MKTMPELQPKAENTQDLKEEKDEINSKASNKDEKRLTH